MHQYEFRAAPVLSAQELEAFKDHHRHWGPGGSPLTKELARLAPGQGVVINRTGKALNSAIAQYARRSRAKFVIRKTGESETTVYRTQ